MQDAYTLRERLRWRVPRNPYTVNTLLEVWECDQVDVQASREFSDN